MFVCLKEVESHLVKGVKNRLHRVVDKIYFGSSEVKSHEYSEHVLKNAVSAVKRPVGFLKEWLVFIFDKKQCDSDM